MFHFSYHAIEDTFLALPWVQSIRVGLAEHLSEVNYLLCRWAGLEPTELSNRTIYFANGRGLTVIEGCSGFKQLLQSAFLLILYPGNMCHILWFVPSALLIVHAVNVFRIAFLTAWSGLDWPFLQWMHDYHLRGPYFLVIFSLWYT
ncbi:MAG: exosortase/archaeosortase family protein [Sphingomonadales bacterium]|nr:exosortase/archaeosortase family protein [Sphingomonadales bacterium]